MLKVGTKVRINLPFKDKPEVYREGDMDYPNPSIAKEMYRYDNKFATITGYSPSGMWYRLDIGTRFVWCEQWLITKKSNIKGW